MNLKEAILENQNYVDPDEGMYVVFAQKVNNAFEPSSDARILLLRHEDFETPIADFTKVHCRGFDYFLEMNIIQDFWGDLKANQKISQEAKWIKRLIQYAENDA
jgi:hypothetical protein